MNADVFNMFIPSYMNGSFNQSDFTADLVGTSDCNMYVPMYCIYSHMLHTFENQDGIKLDVIEYSIPKATITGSRRYDALFSTLSGGTSPRKFYYKLQGVEHNVNAFRGILYTDELEILMCLGVQSDYLFETNIEDFQNFTDTSKLALFLSDKILEPQYKNLLKKLELEYFSKVRTEGIDVISTSRINDWLFKNNFKLPKFKSVMERHKHLTEEIPKEILEI